MSNSVAVSARRLGWLVNFVGSSGDSSRSILPFLPRPLKWLFLMVLLLNVRSWPGVWHARVLSSMVQIQLSRLLNWRTNKKVWWASVSPVGRTPFPTPHAQGPNQSVQIVVKLWATPDDCDWNGHISNSSYAKNLDPLRMRVCMEWFPAFFGDGGWVGLAAAHYHFIREIPIGASYEVRMSVGGWEHDKWSYLVAKFVTLPATSKKTSKSLKLAPETSNAPAKLSLKTHDDDGALIHCIAVSTMCFKHGRVTVPPKIALAVSGFSLSEAGSKRNWELANAIRARGAGAMKDYLRGGWKESEKWWEPSVEVDMERARRVEVLSTLMKGMDGLRIQG
ncbi:hypothetical protein BDV93DRAFT_522250 [Ceratobasidium sp. AG-I]|nr:hypothetical protein BDV93DRAFT_522250 [Ceratobasidium sp. AG-I]